MNVRIQLLRQIKEYRDRGYQVVYTDETWVNQNHHKSYAWVPSNTENLFRENRGNLTLPLPKIPSGKGKRLIILHAGSKEEGFIKGCEDVFIGTEKDGDYHKEMNGDHFLEWFENKLCKVLKKPSVIILDNATYHNRRTEDT